MFYILFISSNVSHIVECLYSTSVYIILPYFIMLIATAAEAYLIIKKMYINRISQHLITYSLD